MQSHVRGKFIRTCAAVVGLLMAGSAPASIQYYTADSVYTQDFNTLPITPENASMGTTPTGWINDTASPAVGNFSIVGWYVFHATALGAAGEGGFDQHQRVRAGAGTSTTGAFYSYGVSASTERALGMLNSNALTAASGNAYFGMRLTNNTLDTLTSFTLSYDGEQWRNSGAAVPVSETDFVQYSVTAPSIQDTPSYTSAGTGLDFVSPVNANTGGGAAVVGNTAGKVSVGPTTVTGINWAPGTDLWIRWVDTNISGNDHGMSIDNVSFSASVPEPTSVTALLAAGALLGLRRRTR